MHGAIAEAGIQSLIYMEGPEPANLCHSRECGNPVIDFHGGS